MNYRFLFSCSRCTGDAYIEGLTALHEWGLHWEWCCHYTHLPFIAQTCARFPEARFVLDHLGRNGGTETDLEDWKTALATLANTCPNVVAKLGAIEEWGVSDPAPLLDFALQTFGFDRVLFESNWFVLKALGYPYSWVVNHIKEAVLRNGGGQAELNKVFQVNADRVYGISN